MPDTHSREPLHLDGLVASLREWADKIEGEPSGIVAFFLRFAFAEAALVESADAPGRTLLVEGAGGGPVSYTHLTLPTKA